MMMMMIIIIIIIIGLWKIKARVIGALGTMPLEITIQVELIHKVTLLGTV